MDLRVENDRVSTWALTGLGSSKTDQKEKVHGDKHGQVQGNHLEQDWRDMSLKIGATRTKKVSGGLSLDVGMSVDEKVGMRRRSMPAWKFTSRPE